MSNQAQPVTQGINREVSLSKEAVNILAAMGIPLPGNIKEITTETVESDETRQIIIPRGMDKLAASQELEKQWKNEEQKVDFFASFPEWNYKDVLVTVKKVTEATFGWMNAKSTWSNPTEIDVVVDIKGGKPINEKAFIGSFGVTTWENAMVEVGIQRDGTAYLSLTAKRKFSDEVTQYFNLLREHLTQHSIYKGRSVVVTASGYGGLDFEIIEIKPSNKIILNKDEASVVNTFIIGALNEPGKRTYLFTGDYGNGKTETAMQVGKIGVEQHDMSFFYLKDAKLFDQVLNTLKQYSPAILFVEDIDEIAGSQDRDAAMNKILNTLDGVQTKGNNLITIFTTNHITKLNAALRRPGRIDLIVRFQNPDKDTVRKIYDAYFKELPGYEDLDMDSIVARTPDCQGAVVAEIAKRVQKYSKTNGNLTTEKVIACIVTMDYHIEVMKGEEKVETPESRLYNSFKDVVISAVN